MFTFETLNDGSERSLHSVLSRYWRETKLVCHVAWIPRQWKLTKPLSSVDGEKASVELS